MIQFFRIRYERFRNVPRKTLVLESPFNKVTGLQACNLIKETPTQVFSREYWEIFKNSFIVEYFWLLLLWWIKKNSDQNDTQIPLLLPFTCLRPTEKTPEQYVKFAQKIKASERLLLTWQTWQISTSWTAKYHFA